MYGNTHETIYAYKETQTISKTLAKPSIQLIAKIRR